MTASVDSIICELEKKGRASHTLETFYVIVPYTEITKAGSKKYVAYETVRAKNLNEAKSLASHSVWYSELSAKLRGELSSFAIQRESIRPASDYEVRKYFSQHRKAV
jgi:hypothetical protein